MNHTKETHTHTHNGGRMACGQIQFHAIANSSEAKDYPYIETHSRDGIGVPGVHVDAQQLAANYVADGRSDDGHHIVNTWAVFLGG